MIPEMEQFKVDRFTELRKIFHKVCVTIKVKYNGNFDESCFVCVNRKKIYTPYILEL